MSKTYKNSNILIFYLISISFTWFISILIITNVLPKWCHYFNALGPSIAAIYMIFKTKTFHTFKQYWNIKKPLWLLIGGFSPILIALLIIFIKWVFNQSIPNLSLLGEVDFLGNIGGFAFLLWLVSFGIGEEIGWRGYLLPHLTKKYSVHTSTLIVWILWVTWHLPFFFYSPNYLNMDFFGILGFAISLFFGATILTWLFEKSNHSIITVILFHTSFNFITASSFGQDSIAMILSMIIIIVGSFININWYTKHKRLQRIDTFE